MSNTVSALSINMCDLRLYVLLFAGRLGIIRNDTPSFSLVEQVSNCTESNFIVSGVHEGEHTMTKLTDSTTLFEV